VHVFLLYKSAIGHHARNGSAAPEHSSLATRLMGSMEATTGCTFASLRCRLLVVQLLVELARDCSSGTGISAQCLPGQQQQR
jgi:hypothetical protein